MFTHTRWKSNYDEVFISELPLNYNKNCCNNNQKRNVNKEKYFMNKFLQQLNLNSNEKLKVLSKYYDQER